MSKNVQNLSRKDQLDSKNSSKKTPVQKLVWADSVDEDSTETKIVKPKLTLSKMMSSTKGSGLLKITLRFQELVTNNGSGATLKAYSMDPTATGNVFTEWTTLSTLYDEFRILSGTVTLIGSAQGSSTPGAILMSYDNDSFFTPTAINDCITYQNCHFSSFYKPFVYKFKRPNVTSSAYWCDVAVPTNSLGCIPWIITNSTANTLIALSVFTIDLELRGRR